MSLWPLPEPPPWSGLFGSTFDCPPWPWPRLPAFEPPPAGCVELQRRDPQRATELGEILLGQRPGRANDLEVTVYKAMGHAIEDLVAAELVYQAALDDPSITRLPQYG